MKLTDIFLFCMAALIWGCSFIFIQLGVKEVPPFLFLVLRFSVCALPLIFIGFRPPMAWIDTVKFGLFWGAFHFGLLFLALSTHPTFGGMPAGSGALIMQAQVVWSLLFSLMIGEKVTKSQLSGVSFVVAGILMLLIPNLLGTTNKIKLIPLIELLIASACWAWSGILMRRSKTADPLRMISWGSLVAVPPLLLLSLLVEGPQAWKFAHAHVSMFAVLGLVYLAPISTLLIFPIWIGLLRRNSPVVSAGFFGTVPLIALVSVAIKNHTPLKWNAIAAGILVFLGIYFNVRKPKTIIPQQ